jgi:hypothetical protein
VITNAAAHYNCSSSSVGEKKGSRIHHLVCNVAEVVTCGGLDVRSGGFEVGIVWLLKLDILINTLCYVIVLCADAVVS